MSSEVTGKKNDVTTAKNNRNHSNSPAGPRKVGNGKGREESSDGMNGSVTNISITGGGSDQEGVQIPLQHDSLTFEGRQSLRLQDMEKRLQEELKRKSRDWDRDVEHMRQEFIELLPVDGEDRDDGSTGDESPGVSFVAGRRGSTDIMDTKNMKTLFLEYPDSGRRYKLRFHVADFDPRDIEVVTDGERIIVTARKTETDKNGKSFQREYQRKIERPKEVDHLKLKSFLTTDGILIVEAPLPPSTLNLRRKTSSQSPFRSSSSGKRGSNSSLKSKSPPSRSPSVGTVGGGSVMKKSRSRRGVADMEVSAEGTLNGTDTSSRSVSEDCLSASSSAPQLSRERYGVPMLREDNGRRKVMLTLDMGQTFSPKEISVQIIKENRIQVKARHEERTSDRLLKNKFSKDYELPEKIETYSLRGGLTPDGKLLVGALIKGHATGLNKVSAGDMLTEDLNNKAEIQPCNILDLSSFPPTTPALILASASWSNPHAQQQ